MICQESANDFFFENVFVCEESSPEGSCGKGYAWSRVGTPFRREMYRFDYCDGFAVISVTVSLELYRNTLGLKDTVTIITTIHFTPERVSAWNVSLWLVWRYRWNCL